MKFLLIFLIIVFSFTSCKKKIEYNRGVQLRFSEDKTVFFSSLENMLSYIEKYNWNLLKAGVKKAYVTDYFLSKDKKSEMWINLNVAFLTYIKDKNGKRILIAFNNPKILTKYKNDILPLNWKYTKPMKEHYFTFIELIRELRASKRGKK